MPHRLTLLFVLLLFSGVLLTAAVAHGASSEPKADPLALEEPYEAEEEGEEGEAEFEEAACEEAEEEFDEGELSAAEVKEICKEEAAEARPPAKSHRRKSKHHPHRHKACHRRAAGGKRHCARRSQRAHRAGRS